MPALRRENRAWVWHWMSPLGRRHIGQIKKLIIIIIIIFLSKCDPLLLNTTSVKAKWIQN